MYNIGIRINHGTFRGIKKVTNHNFVSLERRRLGSQIFIDDWGVVGEVYQCSVRFKELTETDILLKS